MESHSQANASQSTQELASDGDFFQLDATVRDSYAVHRQELGAVFTYEVVSNDVAQQAPNQFVLALHKESAKLFQAKTQLKCFLRK